jgi:polyhydroxybutyrate depolymerase
MKNAGFWKFITHRIAPWTLPMTLLAALAASPAGAMAKEAKTPPPFNIGYHVFDFPYQRGNRAVTLTTNIWFPTEARAAPYTYDMGRRQRTTLLAVDAPLSERRGSYPVVFFVHGNYGCGLEMAFLMEYLAARGFIGVAIDYVDFQVPDYTREVYGCRTHGQKARKRHDEKKIKLARGAADLAEDRRVHYRLFAHEPEQVLDWIIEGRAKPTSFVLDRFLALNADPRSFLYQTIDKERIAISGYSSGAIALESLIGADPDFTDKRFKAALIFSASLFPPHAPSIPGIRIPIMVWVGDDDPAEINLRKSPAARRDVYDLARAPKYFLIIRDAKHSSFVNPGTSREQEADASLSQSRLIAAYSHAFLEKYLFADRAADKTLSQNDPRLRYYIYEDVAGRPVSFGKETYAAVRQDPAPDQFNYLDFDGIRRAYLVHTPPSHDASKPAPVVLVFHGGGGSAESMARLTGMNETADREGFIAVYPQGYPTVLPGRYVWNAGRCCAPATSDNADDVGFVSALLDDMARLYRIDQTRIYATGLSNGAMMSYRLASELSNRIAAIAPVSGFMGYDKIEARHPVSILHIHGTLDKNAPIDGGVGTNANARFRHLSLAENIARWVAFDGCPTTPSVTSLPDISDDGTRVKRKYYGPCTDGAEIIVYIIEGGGHTWPGRPDLAEYYLARTREHNIKPNSRLLSYFRGMGRSTHDISANDVIWDFFKRHTIGN